MVPLVSHSGGWLPGMIRLVRHSSGWLPGMIRPASDSSGWLPGMVPPVSDSSEWLLGMIRPASDSNGWLPGMISPTSNTTGKVAFRRARPTGTVEGDCWETQVRLVSITGSSWWLDGSEASTRIDLQFYHPAQGVPRTRP